MVISPFLPGSLLKSCNVSSIGIVDLNINLLVWDVSDVTNSHSLWQNQTGSICMEGMAHSTDVTEMLITVNWHKQMEIIMATER